MAPCSPNPTSQQLMRYQTDFNGARFTNSDFTAVDAMSKGYQWPRVHVRDPHTDDQALQSDMHYSHPMLYIEKTHTVPAFRT